MFNDFEMIRHRFPEEGFLRVIPSCSGIKIFRWEGRGKRAEREREKEKDEEEGRIIAVFSDRHKSHYSDNFHPAMVLHHRSFFSTPPLHKRRKPLRNSSFSAAIALSFRVLRLFSRVSQAAWLCGGR